MGNVLQNTNNQIIFSRNPFFIHLFCFFVIPLLERPADTSLFLDDEEEGSKFQHVVVSSWLGDRGLMLP